MRYLRTGSYLGTAKRVLNVNGLIISDNEYKNISKFPCHYHENPYFAFILKGEYDEVNKNDRSRCVPGNVIFHNRHEKHSNDNFTPYSRILNLEITEKWLNTHEIPAGSLEKISVFNKSSLEPTFSKLLFECIYSDKYSAVSIELLAADIITELLDTKSNPSGKIPGWVARVREYIHENDSVRISLSELAEKAGVHPVHLSRDFSRFFHFSFGDYIRKTKVKKSLVYLKQKKFPITQIAYCCGFADHSHYTRIFKRFTGLTPLRYRKMICS